MRPVQFVLAGIAVLGATAGAGADSPADNFSRHAIMVGCTEYRHLDQLNLKGPINDVRLMRAVLIDRFGFKAADIVEMTAQSEPRLRPDRENIVREMDQLVEHGCRPGDEVFILFAGHGSQLPDDSRDDPDDDEPDGLDEVFLPEDVTDWKEKESVVRGIRDDMIRRWLTSLSERGVHVMFVADTCSSGTISRGPEVDDAKSTVKMRYVSPEVLTPKEQLLAVGVAERASFAERRAAPVDSALDLPAASREVSLSSEHKDKAGRAQGAMVAFAAVPADAIEHEEAMYPNDRLGDPRYGRLSYAMHHVLTTSQVALTYRELSQQIAWYYRREGWLPLGEIEGHGLGREVLGKREWKDRSKLILGRNDAGQWHLNQGLAYGVTENSIYKVLPAAGSPDAGKVLGFVKVTAAGPVTSIVEPVAYRQAPLVDALRLPVPARCEVEVMDYGQLRITSRVRALTAQELTELTTADQAPRPAGAAAVQAVADAVATICRQSGSLVTVAETDRAANIYLLVAEGQAYLRRHAEAVSESKLPQREHYFGPYPIDGSLATRLDRDLHAIARALNLRRLATNQRVPVEDTLNAVQLQVEFGRGRNVHGPFAAIDDLATTSFTDGDYLQVMLNNIGELAADVTVLYVDARYQIQSWFPKPQHAGNFDNRIAPREKPTAIISCIDDSTVGLEEVVVLAVAPGAGDPRTNYAFLSQPALTAGQFRAFRSAVQPSPLDQLLTAALEGSRALSATQAMRSYVVQRYPITVVKRDAMKP